MNRPLGCLTGTGLLAAGLTALALAVVGVVGGNAMFSPGPLNAERGQRSTGGVRSHADLSHQCAGCHPAFWGPERMGDRCLACHQDVLAELKRASAFHFDLASASNCRDCHTDHHGEAAALTLREIIDFPHDRSGFALLAHPVGAPGGRFRCMDCHPGSLRSFSTESCLGCHQLLDESYAAEHLVDFGADCLACHDGVDRYGAEFDHGGLTFPLDGEHLQIGCASCHLEARTVADLQATPQECFSCHQAEGIHSGRLGELCGQCHTTAGWEGAALDHALTRYPLRGAHVEAPCESCHVDRQWLGLPTDCAACHLEDDPHEGQFVQDCAACHQPTDWLAITFDHARSAYPLVGSHLVAECSGCHPGGRYVGTPTACVACHGEQDEHQGRFGEDCSACHQPTEWSDVTFDHALSRFPLTGAHRFTPCESCHREGSFSGAPLTCAGCHADPAAHRGLFGLNCASCHNTSAWLPASYNGPHPFPMNHGGAGGRCSTCHPSSLLDYTCYECHEHSRSRMQEEHEGVSNLSDCTRCHPTGSKEGLEDEGDDD